MKLSDERISHISHLIWDGLYNDDLVDYVDDDESLKTIKFTLMNYLKIDDEIDEAVRAKIASLKRGVTEAHREWDVLYRKYFEEEANKRRF